MFRHLLIALKLLPPEGKEFFCLIERITGLKPRDTRLYQQALCHKSLMRKTEAGHPLNNERLEYLGDAILGAVVADELYKRFPEKDEGALTKMRARIVNRNHLNRLAMEMGLGELIQTQPLSDIAQTHIPGDGLEALIGAIYLDHGYRKARQFILKRVFLPDPQLEQVFKKDSNFKSLLIEWGQKRRCDIHFVTEEYPDFDCCEPIFIAQAYVNKKAMGEGKGSTKKEAQQKAAGEALERVSHEAGKVLS